MVTIDKTTGAVTVDGTVTEEQVVAQVTLNVELNGQTGSTTADVVQEAEEKVATSYKLFPIRDEEGVCTEAYLLNEYTKEVIKENTVLPKDAFEIYYEIAVGEVDNMPKGYLVGYNDDGNEVSRETVEVECGCVTLDADETHESQYYFNENTTTIQRSILFKVTLYTLDRKLQSDEFDYYIYQAGTEIRTDPDPENGDFYYIQTFDGEKPIQAGFDSYTGEQDEYGVLCSINNPFERRIQKDLLKHYGLFGVEFAEDGSDQDILDTYYKGILYYRFTYQANGSSDVVILDEGVIEEYIASTQYIWTPSEVHETGTYRLTCSMNEIPNDDPEGGEPEPED